MVLSYFLGFFITALFPIDSTLAAEGSLPAACPTWQSLSDLLLPVIEPSWRPRVSGEYRTAGTLIRSPADLNGLAPGTYNYLIGEGGERIITPIVPEVTRSVDHDEVYAGHAALYQSLVELASEKRPPRIIGAGDFDVGPGGRVTRFTNGSGHFKGGRANLHRALRELKEAGLPLDHNAVIIDFSVPGSTGKTSHASDVQNARAMIRIRKSLRLTGLQRALQQQAAKLHVRLPVSDPEPLLRSRAQIDSRVILEVYLDHEKLLSNPRSSLARQLAARGVRLNENEIFALTQFWTYWNDEGAAVRLVRTIDEHGEQSALSMIKTTQKFLIFLDTLPPSALTRLDLPTADLDELVESGELIRPVSWD